MNRIKIKYTHTHGHTHTALVWPSRVLGELCGQGSLSVAELGLVNITDSSSWLLCSYKMERKCRGCGFYRNGAKIQ